MAIRVSGSEMADEVVCVVNIGYASSSSNALVASRNKPKNHP